MDKSRFKCLQDESEGGRTGAKRPFRRLRDKCSLEETWCSDPGQLAFRGKWGKDLGNPQRRKLVFTWMQVMK